MRLIGPGQIMYLPERIGRRLFWTWAIPLVIAHAVASFARLAGFRAAGGVDTVIVAALAIVVAGRFRDIGWIGGSLLIALLFVAPLMVTAYAVVNHLPSADFLDAMNRVGLCTGAASLVPLAIAGSVQGSQPQAPLPAGQPADIQPPPAEAGSPQPAAGGHWKPHAFALRFGIVALVVATGLFVALLIARQNPTSAPSSLQAGREGQQTQGNGLTRDTNDFLRQLSSRPPAPARP